VRVDVSRGGYYFYKMRYGVKKLEMNEYIANQIKSRSLVWEKGDVILYLSKSRILRCLHKQAKYHVFATRSHFITLSRVRSNLLTHGLGKAKEINVRTNSDEIPSGIFGLYLPEGQTDFNLVNVRISQVPMTILRDNYLLIGRHHRNAGVVHKVFDSQINAVPVLTEEDESIDAIVGLRMYEFPNVLHGQMNDYRIDAYRLPSITRFDGKYVFDDLVTFRGRDRMSYDYHDVKYYEIYLSDQYLYKIQTLLMRYYGKAPELLWDVELDLLTSIFGDKLDAYLIDKIHDLVAGKMKVEWIRTKALYEDYSIILQEELIFGCRSKLYYDTLNSGIHIDESDAGIMRGMFKRPLLGCVTSADIRNDPLGMRIICKKSH
jgi:hypothetical protein